MNINHYVKNLDLNNLYIKFSVTDNMDSFHEFGNTFDNDYPRFTQFIMDYNTKRVSILKPNNTKFIEYNILNPNILSKKYNKYKASSFVISTDISSFNETYNDFLELMLDFFTLHDQKIRELIRDYDIDFIGILEYKEQWGWHLHLVIFYKRCEESNKDYDNIQKDVFKILYSISTDFKRDIMDQIYLNVQTVRSVGSIIHYLKKDPFILLANTTEIAQMYVHYERTHIFPEHSKPKFTNIKKHELTKDQVIEFFKTQIQDGCKSLQEALQHPYATNILANFNLRELFTNTHMFYLANRKFSDSIKEIITKFYKQPWYKKCFCPINEYLTLQNIDKHDFEIKFSNWLKCVYKKNSIMFVGPADTGKSVFLSSLHNNFRYNNRLTLDGIFTWSNALNADCVYHEEPLITPETAEVAKLVYEGNAHTTIAVKGKDCFKLGKKIPVLISANFPIYQYCSGQKPAFEARIHKFEPKFILSKYNFCDDDETVTHTCSPLNTDIQRRTYKTLHGKCSEEDIRCEFYKNNENKENISPNAETLNANCKSIHKLRKCHWRAYIVYIILKYHLSEYFAHIDTYLEYPNIKAIDFNPQTLPYPVTLPNNIDNTKLQNLSDIYIYLGYKNILGLSDCNCYQLY